MKENWYPSECTKCKYSPGFWADNKKDKYKKCFKCKHFIKPIDKECKEIKGQITIEEVIKNV
ncbi:hypothetical protein NL50_17985 [Clostridium acetobutylicum]|nr:hypothetical protein NL50_17985 [Clostridium acetobutylicum]